MQRQEHFPIVHVRLDKASVDLAQRNERRLDLELLEDFDYWIWEVLIQCEQPGHRTLSRGELASQIPRELTLEVDGLTDRRRRDFGV